MGACVTVGSPLATPRVLAQPQYLTGEHQPVVFGVGETVDELARGTQLVQFKISPRTLSTFDNKKKHSVSHSRHVSVAPRASCPGRGCPRQLISPRSGQHDMCGHRQRVQR